jgi:hypothetical protein
MPAPGQGIGFDPRATQGIAETIMAARQAQQRQEAERAEMLLRQQQFDAQQSLIAQKRRDEGIDAVTKALDAGRPDLARQLGGNYGINVGTQLGPQHGEGDTLMAPSMTRQVPQEPVMGPVQPEGMEGRDEFVDSQKPTRTEMVPQAPMAVKPRAQSYTIDGIGYDQEEGRQARQIQLAEEAGRQRRAYAGFGPRYADMAAGVAAGGDPNIAKVVSSAIEHDTAREVRAEKEEQRAFQSIQNDLNRQQSDVNNQRMSAAVGAGKGVGIQLKAEQGDRQEEAGLDGVVNKVFQNLGFKEIQAQNRKFNDMAAGLTKKNAALDAKTAGSWVKEAQGGTGVISDADMRQFWDRVGGWGIRTQEAVEGALSGQLGADKRRIVAEAVRELAARAQTNLQTVKESVRRRLETSAYAHRLDDAMATYFPEERSKIDDARAIDKSKNKTRANRVKAGGRDALDADLESM